MSIISEFASLCDIPFGGSVVTRCKTPGRRLASQYVSASSSYKMPHIDANAEFESLCDNPMLTWELVCGIRVAMRQRLGSQLFESHSSAGESVLLHDCALELADEACVGRTFGEAGCIPF